MFFFLTSSLHSPFEYGAVTYFDLLLLIIRVDIFFVAKNMFTYSIFFLFNL